MNNSHPKILILVIFPESAFLYVAFIRYLPPAPAPAGLWADNALKFCQIITFSFKLYYRSTKVLAQINLDQFVINVLYIFRLSIGFTSLYLSSSSVLIVYN